MEKSNKLQINIQLKLTQCLIQATKNSDIWNHKDKNTTPLYQSWGNNKKKCWIFKADSDVGERSAPYKTQHLTIKWVSSILTDWGTYCGLIPWHHLGPGLDFCSGLGPLLDSDYGFLCPRCRVESVSMTYLCCAVNTIFLDCTFSPQVIQTYKTGNV